MENVSKPEHHLSCALRIFVTSHALLSVRAAISALCCSRKRPWYSKRRL